jgi:type IV pilus assembly protein PilN
MRIPINLSSEPFRRDRPMIAAYAACAVALTGLLCVLVFLIVSERHRARDAREAVARVNAQLRTITAKQAEVDAFLRQPPNAEVLQRSVLLNELIDRKSISWTRIFADLESVMPYNVRLISVRLPQITPQNEVLLNMVVGAKEPGSVIAFLKRLEESPRFGTIYGQSSQPPAQNEPLYRYTITVNYAQKL